MTSKFGYTIILPVFNEEENIAVLASEIELALVSISENWECIWIDDCSEDDSWSEIKSLGAKHIGVKLSKNYGQSTAIMAGVDLANFENLITMDADLQNDPRDIPQLISAFTDDFDLVCGFRQKRQDNFFSRKIPSKIANFLARKISKIEISDLGCSLKIFRKSFLKQNRIMGEMHRVLAIHFFELGARIKEIPTNHRQRLYGKSKYGINRTLKFIADIVLAKVMSKMMSKPLYVFGYPSFIFFCMACVFVFTAVFLRISGYLNYLDSTLIVGGFTIFGISILLIACGLIAEMLLRLLVQSNRDNQYTIAEEKN